MDIDMDGYRYRWTCIDGHIDIHGPINSWIYIDGYMDINGNINKDGCINIQDV